jgi:hypothetical protein
VGFSDYISGQRARRIASVSTLDGDTLAEATGYVVNAAIIACTGQTQASRLGAGVTTGATYAASLAALGATAAGAYGAAVGAVVGFAAGFAQGFTPTNRSTFSDRFGAMVATLTPGVRQRLVAYCEMWAATCRNADGHTPLGAWRTIDQVNVNILGSSQIMCLWAMQHLIVAGILPPESVVGSYSPSAPFDSLPWSHRYCVGLLVSNCEDSDQLKLLSASTLDTGHVAVNPTSGSTLLDEWLNANSNQVVGDQANAGDAVLDVVTLGAASGVQSRTGILCGAIRTSLETVRSAAAALPDMTTLPNDPASLAMRADPQNIALAAVT